MPRETDDSGVTCVHSKKLKICQDTIRRIVARQNANPYGLQILLQDELEELARLLPEHSNEAG